MHVQALPHAPEMEQAVLGTLMVYRSAIGRVSEYLTPDMFYSTGHVCIYRAILALDRMSVEPNILSVTQWLRSDNTLKDAGGPGYIADLTNRISHDGGLDYHARVVQQKYILRRMILSSDAVMKAAYDNEDCFDVMDIARKGLDHCQSSLAPNILSSAATEVNALIDGKKPNYIRFNTPDLCDNVMFQRGLVHVVAGRTGMGKSIFSTEEAWGWTQLGRVLMFSPEMRVDQITSRILARESGVPYTTILHGKMTAQDQDIVAMTGNRIGGRLGQLLIDDTSSVTPDRVRAVLDKQLEQGVVAVVIDHLHEMTSGISKIDNDPSSRAKVAYCITQINEIAKSRNVPFLVMAQLNREVESRTDRRPRISDIAWAGEIEQKSAMIGLLYREGYYSPEKPYHDELEIGIAKYRDGATGLCKAPITPALSRIGTPPMSIARAANATNDESEPF